MTSEVDRTPGLRSRKRDAREAALLRVAAELVVENGIGGTSLAEVGKRAGYSHALVNHRFGSKDGLVDRLSDAADSLYRERVLDAVADQTGLDSLVTFACVYLDLVRGEDPFGRVHIVLWSEALATSPKRRPVHLTWDREFRHVVARFIERGIDDSTIAATVDVEAAAFGIVGMLRGIAMQLILDKSLSLEASQASLPLLLPSLLAAEHQTAAK